MRMTTSDKQNIERKLNHVLDMGKRIIDLYPHISCTERAALLLAMLAAVRHVGANMRTVSGLLRENLLDPFGIEYTEYARSYENLQKIWKEELKGAPIFHNLDNQSHPLHNPNEIALKEDTDYDFSILPSDEEDNFSFFDTRIGLMYNAPLMSEAIEIGLEQIGKTLREIVNDYQQLKADVQMQEERFKKLERQYEEIMWEDDKERLVGEVKEYVVLCNNSKDKYTFKLFLDRLDRLATDPHDNKVLADLNEWFLGGERPSAFVVENRDKLDFEDLANHFCFVKTRNLIVQEIESFELLKPADEEYKDLFVNQASQELAFLLSHTIGYYVDFRHNYQYAALQMAMQDLGLVYVRNNGVQMRDFVNKAFLTDDEEKIKDQTTLTQWTGKLLGRMFGTMDENNLVGNFTKKDFEKLKDYYWLCLSIINKVVQLDLEEFQFAPYLFEEHENTPIITEYKNREGQSIMKRLAVIKSVIKGESLFR